MSCRPSVRNILLEPTGAESLGRLERGDLIVPGRGETDSQSQPGHGCTVLHYTEYHHHHNLIYHIFT